MFLRAMPMILMIEERKGRETVIMLSKRRSSGTPDHLDDQEFRMMMPLF